MNFILILFTGEASGWCLVWTAMDRKRLHESFLLFCRVGSPRPPSLNEVGWDLEVGDVTLAGPS